MISLFRPVANTNFISFDEKQCKACWKCIDACPQKVISKINLPWHKHAILVHPLNCKGCKKCISACNYNAFSPIENSHKNKKTVAKPTLINNFILAITAIATIFSGYALQIGFHIGRSQAHISNSSTLWGFDYASWSAIHKLSIVFFSFYIIIHISAHWKWYKTVFSKNLYSKNFSILSLTILFFTLAFTGIIPWLTETFHPISSTRLILIEIHDKIALLFTILVLAHIYKRKSWFLKFLRNDADQKRIF